MPSAISNFIYWLDSSGWLGIMGLVLTVLGFTITGIGALRSASAAEKTRAAVAQAVVEVKKLKVITDLSAAGSELEEIKRFARSYAWPELPERLSRVRRLLIGTKANHPELPLEDQSAVLDAIVAFTELEKLLIRNAQTAVKINKNRVNSLLIDHSNRLIEIIARTL